MVLTIKFFLFLKQVKNRLVYPVIYQLIELIMTNLIQN